MFKSEIEGQTEANVIDVLRKYAPYLIAASAAVGTLVALYYSAFGKADEFVTGGFENAGDSVNDATEVAQQSQYTAADDVGLDGTTAVW